MLVHNKVYCIGEDVYKLIKTCVKFIPKRNEKLRCKIEIGFQIPPSQPDMMVDNFNVLVHS